MTTDGSRIHLVIKESDFSSQQELFIKFECGDSKHHTMAKDGEGKHVIWNQTFNLDNVTSDQLITFYAMEGAPLDSKQIGKTKEVQVTELLSETLTDKSIDILDNDGTKIGYLKISSQKAQEESPKQESKLASRKPSVDLKTMKKIEEASAKEEQSPTKLKGMGEEKPPTE